MLEIKVDHATFEGDTKSELFQGILDHHRIQTLKIYVIPGNFSVHKFLYRSNVCRSLLCLELWHVLVKNRDLNLLSWALAHNHITKTLVFGKNLFFGRRLRLDSKAWT